MSHSQAYEPAPAVREKLVWRLTLAGLAAGCLALNLIGCHGYDLLADDEIRYAEAGRCMVETGNWFIPEFNGYARYQKPIFFYWLQALAQLLLGSSAWAARLPTALAATALVLLTAQLGRSLWGSLAGLWAGVALAISVEIFLLARMVMTDIVLLLFMQGAITSFCLAKCKPASAKWHYLLLYVWLALGVLTKGPIAIALPAAIIVPWLLVRGEFWATLGQARPVAGLLIFLGIAGPWYLLAHQLTWGEFTWHFFFQENVGRFSANVNKHEPPVYFYFLLLIPMTFPWTGILPQSMLSAVRGVTRKASFTDAVAWLFLWQVVFVMVLFTFSRTRVWTYTLAIFPALALFVGRWLAVQIEARRQGDKETKNPLRLPLWLFVGGSLLAAVGGWLLPAELLPAALQGTELLAALRMSLTLFFIVSLLVLHLDYTASLTVTLWGLVGGVACGYAFLALVLAPAVDRAWKQPIRDVAQAMRPHQPATVITYMVHELGWNFHTGNRRVHHWREGDLFQIRAMLESDLPVFVIVAPDRRHELAEERFYVWGEHPRFLYGANFPPGQGGPRPSPPLSSSSPALTVNQDE